MRVWRLTKPQFAPGLDGEGARLWGGIWNNPVFPMVYAASSLALAILEYYVHLPPQMRLRSALPELVAIALDVPNDAIETLSVPDLANLTLQDTRDIGDDWIRSRRSLGLLVPSRAVPYDLNLLVNPAHPRLGQALIAIQTPFLFDDRLAI